MDSDNNSFTPSSFEAAAGNDLAIWQTLKNCQVVHTRFGNGIITTVEKNKRIVFNVRFDKPYEGVCERQFMSAGFGEYFVGLTLTDEKIDKVRSHILARSVPKPNQVEALKTEYRNDPNKLRASERKRVIRVKPGIYRSPSGKKPKLRKMPSTNILKCPFCIFMDSFLELSAHIRLDHPKEYPEWAKGNKQSKERSSGSVIRNKADTENPPEAEMAQCPLCGCALRSKNYQKHLKKAHPGKSAEEHPLTIEASTRSSRSRKHKKTMRPFKPSWRMPSGERAPTDMKVLNVGRKSKHYTRRW